VEYQHQIVEKTKNTMRQRFGVDHHMQLPAQQQKVKDANMVKYGVEFPLQNPAINNKFHNTLELRTEEYRLDIKQRTQQTFQTKYGVNSASQLHLSSNTLDILHDADLFKNFVRGKPRDEIVQELGIHPHCLYLYSKKYHALDLIAPKTKSQFELEMEQFLQSMNINYVCNTRTIISPWELDFYMPDIDVAIECNGLYWHSENSSGRGKHYHENKFIKCKNLGIKLITIFDDEWINQRNQVQTRLQHILHSSQDLIYARNCQVILIDHKQAQGFCQQHHLQGHVSAKHYLGLQHQGNLVAVMSLDKSRFNKTHEYELLRFCSLGVVGAAGKLLKFFISQFNPTSIISYSNNNWGWGELYEKLGFKFLGSTLGYQYTDYHQRFNRMRFQKKLLVAAGNDNSLTEWQIMQDQGYDRVWDCGQSTWSLIL
jgi:hypothetical protein